MHTTTSTLTNQWTPTRAAWAVAGTAPTTRRWLRRLATTDPRFGPWRTPGDLVETAARYDTVGIDLAAGLLEHAADPTAAMVLFEAARPRLEYLARQARGYAHQTRCPELVDPDRTSGWEAPDVIDANIISWAHEWIATNAGTTNPHPIRAMRDWIRDQLRADATRAIRLEHAANELAEHTRDRLCDTDPAPTPGDRLYAVLIEARDAGLISPRDASLVFATRVGAVTLCDAAAAHGVGYDTARRQRRRAETQLHHLAPATTDTPRPTVAPATVDTTRSTVAAALGIV